MLVLKRKRGQSMTVGKARIKVLEAHAGTVILGVEAPKSVEIRREEAKRGPKSP